MVVGIGLDIVDIDEWQLEADQKGRPWIERVFTAAERRHCEKNADPYRSFAGVLAAKEAALKAHGTGWSDQTDWQDVEILHDSGQPTISVTGPLLELSRRMSISRIVASISHTKHYAAAVVILEA